MSTSTPSPPVPEQSKFQILPKPHLSLSHPFLHTIKPNSPPLLQASTRRSRVYRSCPCPGRFPRKYILINRSTFLLPFCLLFLEKQLQRHQMNSTSDSRSSLHATSTSQPTSLNPTWESRYQELLRWRAEHGDTCVPKAEGALGRWVARQRELKRTGSKFETQLGTHQYVLKN